MLVESRVEMIRKISYVTSDGRDFKSQKDAENHEFKVSYNKKSFPFNKTEPILLSYMIKNLESLLEKEGKDTYIKFPRITVSNTNYSGYKIVEGALYIPKRS